MAWGKRKAEAANQSPSELCLQTNDGQRCTLPKGHSGDHIASSVRQSNIIGAWRQDDSNKRQ